MPGLVMPSPGLEGVDVFVEIDEGKRTARVLYVRNRATNDITALHLTASSPNILPGETVELRDPESGICIRWRRGA